MTLILICFLPSLLAQDISLNLSNVTVKSAMEAFQRESGFTFVFASDDVDLQKIISLNMRNATVVQAITQILQDQNVSHEIINKTIIVRRRPQIEVTQQNIAITGTVSDDYGDPLPGVYVIIKGTGTGTVTDADGNYSVTVPDKSAVIQFSYIGYDTNDISVGDNKIIHIQLRENAHEMDEVVVVGYGTQKRVNLTGAVEAVGSEVFDNRSLPNTTQALQGAIPNLNILMEDGKPSRSANFNVRGATSIGSGGSSLILIDGVEGDPAMLNPNDIESVSVLKDAASAAIYGARGSFGVILITTKRPQKGKTTVNYTGNYSFQSPTRRPDFVTDAVTFVEHFRESYLNAMGTVPTGINSVEVQPYSDEWLDKLRAWKASGAGPKTEVRSDGRYEYYCNTDWIDLMYKKQAFAQDHNLLVSGGNERADFYVSGRFYDYSGLFNFDPDTYRSYNIRAKSGLQAFKWLKITNNLEFTNSDYHNPGAFTLTPQVYVLIRTSPPSVPLYNPDGTFTRAASYFTGSCIEGNNYTNFNKKLFKNTVGFSSTFFDETFRVNGDLTIRFDTNRIFRKRVLTPFSTRKDIIEYMGSYEDGYILETWDNTLYTAANIYTEYENTFNGNHNVKGLVGYGYEKSGYHYNEVSRNGLLLDMAESIALATGESIVPNASVNNWRIIGAYFRLNYGYKNRYLLEINGRYDGSSKFPLKQQFGFFPSISGGWRLSEEPFWNVNRNILSDVKFRASYGSLGNGNVNPYSYLELLSISNSGRLLNGSRNKQTGVPAPIPAGLTWEKATTLDYGLDFGMLQGRFRFSGDYYIRKTTDMYTVGVTLPDVFGANSPRGNYADMTTKGWEITLSYQNRFTLGGKPFNLQVKGSIWDYYTRIDRYNNATKALSDYYEGQTLGEVWGFKSDGLYRYDPSPNEYNNTLLLVSRDRIWRAGDIKIASLSGKKDENGAILINRGANTVDDPGDMAILGNTEPRYQYSFSLNADWNNFFITTFFMGVGKQDWWPLADSPFWGQYNRPYSQLPKWHLGNYWTEDNPDAYLPRYVGYNASTGYPDNVKIDRWKQNVAYLRLKNLTIGYNLPSRFITILGMEKARIYLSGENIFCWSPLYRRTKDFDVLTFQGNTDSNISNVDQGYGNGYPLMKTITLGLSLTF